MRRPEGCAVVHDVVHRRCRMTTRPPDGACRPRPPEGPWRRSGAGPGRPRGATSARGPLAGEPVAVRTVSGCSPAVPNPMPRRTGASTAGRTPPCAPSAGWTRVREAVAGGAGTPRIDRCDGCRGSFRTRRFARAAVGETAPVSRARPQDRVVVDAASTCGPPVRRPRLRIRSGPDRRPGRRLVAEPVPIEGARPLLDPLLQSFGRPAPGTPPQVTAKAQRARSPRATRAPPRSSTRGTPPYGASGRRGGAGRGPPERGTLPEHVVADQVARTEIGPPRASSCSRRSSATCTRPTENGLRGPMDIGPQKAS